MAEFKQYMKNNDDIEESLKKIPKAHRALVHGFKINLEPTNTLHGDDGHVGVIMTDPHKEIRVASPWNYPREFAFLHEVGHLVYEKYVRGKDLEKEWSKIVKLNHGRKKEEPDEENFSHAYAAYYCKHPPVTHHNEEWRKFIKNLPQ
jgi:hypothetical protein